MAYPNFPMDGPSQSFQTAMIQALLHRLRFGVNATDFYFDARQPLPGGSMPPLMRAAVAHKLTAALHEATKLTRSDSITLMSTKPCHAAGHDPLEVVPGKRSALRRL